MRLYLVARRRSQQGMTFLFVLMLSALLGITLLVAVEVDSTLMRRNRELALLQIGHEFRQALERYRTGRNGIPPDQYPQQLDDLLLDRRYQQPMRHLRRLPTDPISGKAEWGLVRQGGRIVGLHSLSTLKPMKQDGFDPDDAAFRGASNYREWIFTYPVASATDPAPAASAPPASFAPSQLPTSAEPTQR